MIDKETTDISYLMDKLTFNGADKLSDIQLLTVLLGRGAPKENHYQKAKQLIERHGSLDEVIASPLSELSSGVIASLRCSVELGRRLKADNSDFLSIENSDDAEIAVRELLKGATSEEFWVICLNRSLKVIDKQCLFRGGVTSSVVDIKILMKYILNNLSSAVIIAHNHPSGSVEPSREDIDITNQINEGLKLFDIVCFDHIITANNEVFSFRKSKML